jgi:hypothetical protein
LHASLVSLLVSLSFVTDDSAESFDFVLRDGNFFSLELVRDLELRESLSRGGIELPEVPVVLRKEARKSISVD